MKKLIAGGLIVLGLLIIAHHWYVHDRPVDVENLLSHEFFAGLVLSLGLGGLLL